jgi:predicted MFS family arabinose efflux permease
VSGAADEAPRVGYGEALRSAEFRALFASQAVAIAGTSVAAVALTVLVYDRTGSAFVSSLTFALGFLPYVFGGGLLSSVVDRVRPRPLANACSAASAAIAVLMAVPGMPVPALLALLFVLGTLGALAGGARTALLRATVAESAYVPARSLMKLAGQVAQIGGNAVGGALVVALGTSGTILVNAAAYVLALALVRLGVRDHPNPAGSAAAGLLRDSVRGAREIFARVELSRLLLLGWLVPMFSVAPEALAAPYISAHDASPQLVGWWLAAIPLGTVVGDIAGVRFLRPVAQRRLVAPIAALGFVPYLLFAVDPPVPAALVLLALSGLCGMWSLGYDGLVRLMTPDRLFARTMTLNSAGLMTLQGLGFALAGAVAEWTTASTAVMFAGVAGVAVVGAWWAVSRSSAGTSVEAPNLP